MPRRLIVNADDLGANPARNAGILQAHLRGVATSTTLLANLPGAADAARRLREAPALGVGLHLNLAEGRPLGTGYETLAGPDGAFWGKLETRRRLRAGRIAPDEIRREIAAQLDRAEALGIRPTHVDGHHHVHIYPGVMDPLAAAMRERGIAWTRLPSALLAGPSGLAPERAAALAEYADLTPAAREAARRHGLRTTEAFLGLTLLGAITTEGLLEALAGAPEGLTELMAHPGLADPLAGGFSGPERETELAVLTDPRLREGIARLGFALVSFRDPG